ncbi:hypothetical protein [Streptomyces sp. WMMC897]|uniref:hypothetical protein n=1 Tax=Streptomyces sp. WMMC897 TaxID=3014782 RepID=UPI0022B66BB0|nr:hypothetical protein [Streptomyces sp. WMMC897]MCZ7413024.1 hypothetical protein [Streptomyces sp. WMMC897]MCZ7413094.1 hypothetical protein [Streptomyces sp. WMMC897]MCZ7415434.1 hypothetical protein [Streptomyces sp. WMMC897]
MVNTSRAPEPSGTAVEYPPARALRRCDRCHDLTNEAVPLGVAESDTAAPRELYACPRCAPSTRGQAS